MSDDERALERRKGCITWWLLYRTKQFSLWVPKDVRRRMIRQMDYRSDDESHLGPLTVPDELRIDPGLACDVAEQVADFIERAAERLCASGSNEGGVGRR